MLVKPKYYSHVKFFFNKNIKESKISLQMQKVLHLRNSFNKSSLKVTFAIFWQNRQTPKYGFATTATQLISNNLNPLASPVRENFFSPYRSLFFLYYLLVFHISYRDSLNTDQTPKWPRDSLAFKRSCVQRPVGRATSTRFLSFSSLYQECLTCGTLLERKVLLWKKKFLW